MNRVKINVTPDMVMKAASKVFIKHLNKYFKKTDKLITELAIGRSTVTRQELEQLRKDIKALSSKVAKEN